MTLARTLFLLLVILARTADAAPTPMERDLAGIKARWFRENRSPQAVVAVMRTLELWDQVDPQELVRFLYQAASEPRAHPLARAHALFAAYVAALRVGDGTQARKFLSELGVVTRWKVAGPYPNRGREGFDIPYPPEEAISAATAQGGGAADVAWREVPEELLQNGAVPLGAMLRPDTESVAYAVSWIFSERARDVAVRVGSTGATKAWLNGGLVLARDLEERPLQLDQEAVMVRLASGWNRLLVKVAVIDGAWAFTLRITSRDGSRVPGVRFESAPPSGGEIARAPLEPRQREASCLAVLLKERARKAKGTEKEAALRDLALYLARVVPDGVEATRVEQLLNDRAIGARPSMVTLLARSRHAETAEARRSAAEAILLGSEEAAPWIVAEAAWRLGLHAEESGQQRTAAGFFQDALRRDPTYWPAELRLCALLQNMGMVELAHERMSALALAYPNAGRIQRELASSWQRRGHSARAESILLALVPTARDDTVLLGELASLARDQGHVEKALARQREIIQARPFSTGAYLSLAEAYLDAGQVSSALAAFDQGLTVAPKDARLLEKSGRTLVERGGAARRAEGIARLEQALTSRPQNPDLRRYIDGLRPGREDLEGLFAREPLELARRYRDFKGTSRTVLLDLKVTRVLRNGLSEVFVQRLVRIEDKAGAEAERVQEIPYEPDTQSIDVRTARVWKPNGDAIEAVTRDERSVSEPWYGLFYDVRAEVIRFPHLEAGDIVELSYVVADVGIRNLLSDYFGDLHYFAEDAPRAESEYVLLAPARKELFFSPPSQGGLERSVTERNGQKCFRFLLKRVPKVDVEPRMPGWTEVVPFLHVSTYRTWEEVGRWYFALIKDQLVSDESVRAAVRSAVTRLGRAATTADKVRAVHDFVAKNTRYVGLEFGIHGYKPYRVPQVLTRKFGDCKDKAALTVVMLRELGIDAKIVLLRTRRNGDVGEEPASLAVFDHAIAHVPSLDLYLDGTAEFSGSSELPSEDQGVMALIVDATSAKLVRTPVLAAEHSLMRRNLKIKLDESFGAKVSEDVTTFGQRAAEWRKFYQAPSERRDRYERAWNGWFPGAGVARVEMPDLNSLEKPVRVHAEGSVPELGWKAGGGTHVLPAIGRRSELARTLTGTSKRKHDLVLDHPWVDEETVEHELAPGFDVRALPRGEQISGPHGTFSLSIAKRGTGRVAIAYSLRVTSRRIPASEHAAFRAFLTAVDAALNQGIEVTR
ncbi:MAG: DUF3857 domain-containing protein [Deltaproteobacteria bacterium]|nr:DUF3857 domain-containing protein [Deltaproteobacteria bacterium]